jgi:glycosyltransferase involved in cell wall biosynthesis
MKKIAIVGQYPMPIHGLSKAVDTLYKSKLNKVYNFEKIDIKDNKKFIKNMINIMKSNSDVFYFTISQSAYGNLRDIILLTLIALRKKKSIIHLHGGYYRNMFNHFSKNRQYINKLIIGKASSVIVLGESLKYIFKGIIHENSIKIVKNCVDKSSLLSKDVINEKINYIERKRKIQVLFLSNLIESKGYKIVLNLAKITKNSSRNFKFIFAGEFFDKKDKLYFNEYIRKHNLTNIEYIGVVTGVEKLNVLKNSDILILPTFYKKEGQPISIIEAMGNGLAVITTNHAGIPDLVEDNENGFLVCYEDINLMFDKLNMLYDDRNLLKEISKKNIKKIRDDFLEEHYIESLNLIFREV